ncbi:Methyltransferase domain-containing protein [Salinimicrobium catena]|uniref:Methyltransferase domain-containing protein n=1 Tax=Salinimicrobium catena TaxID=390640 RepID=A0A1H5NQE8_9FLAO|nr:class I SAM-dependent methyltransferase [Salinimicrobium catena]SDL54436.1 Methyltransferase domain-containing protein [Salinimicrobium catena]SEF03912.1 Methyltransferase domain-containing protein [Salinimicrobium catena]
MNNEKKNPDILGNAIKAYFEHGEEEDIAVHSPDFDDDVIPVAYLFRNYEQMPPLEKKALQLCREKVLDVGCGAGSHSLYLQKEENLKVTAIDTSEGAIEVCKKRGITDARNVAFEELSEEKFDTILLLMNGTGIVGKMNRLDDFFYKLKQLLNPGGQVIIDSSDLIYLFEADEDGGVWVDSAQGYYGELSYSLSYKGETSEVFDWLYLDYDSLSLAAAKNGFSCELIKEGEHYDYLAKLTINEK